jgi:hypothetical protein
VTVAECIAVGELHAAGLPLLSSSSLRRCPAAQTTGLFMCVSSEGLDTTVSIARRRRGSTVGVAGKL